MPRGAMCVQRFDDSLNSAIHITYRISLRSSSMREPRDPLLKVLNDLMFNSDDTIEYVFNLGSGRHIGLPKQQFNVHKGLEVEPCKTLTQ